MRMAPILEKAKTAAEKADAVVFVAGYDYNDEGGMY